MKNLQFTFQSFYLFEFVVRCVYFYNRKISDIIFVTVIGQILMTLTIMIVTFAGRWFTFPRSVLGYSFIIGIIVLSLWRILVYYLYLRSAMSEKLFY